MEMGSVAELVGGVASIVAAVMSIAALFVAIQANNHAKLANATSTETLRESTKTRNDALDARKRADRASVASQLQAWWVATAENEWGGRRRERIIRSRCLPGRGDLRRILGWHRRHHDRSAATRPLPRAQQRTRQRLPADSSATDR